MQDPPTWNPRDDLAGKLGEILLHARRQPTAAARVLYLNEACGDDQELRAQVNSLLRAEAEAGEFLSPELLT